MAATVTLEELRELVKAVIKAELSVNNKAYPDSLIDDAINGIYQDTINGTVIDPDTGETVTKTNVTFLEEDAFFSTVQSAQISVLAVVGGDTLSLDTTNYQNAGAVRVEGNIITYSGKTATELTGVATTGTGSIEFAHEPGKRVRQLFQVPSDYNYAARLAYDGLTNLLPEDYRKFLERYNTRFYNELITGTYRNNDNNNLLRTDVFYTILRDTYLLPIVREVSGKPLQLSYQKGVNDLVEGTDICLIPDKYCKRVIKYIAASNVVADRGEVDLASAWYRRGIKEVKKMYKVEGAKTRELQFGQRVGTSSDVLYNI